MAQWSELLVGVTVCCRSISLGVQVKLVQIILSQLFPFWKIINQRIVSLLAKLWKHFYFLLECISEPALSYIHISQAVEWVLSLSPKYVKSACDFFFDHPIGHRLTRINPNIFFLYGLVLSFTHSFFTPGHKVSRWRRLEKCLFSLSLPGGAAF